MPAAHESETGREQEGITNLAPTLDHPRTRTPSPHTLAQHTAVNNNTEPTIGTLGEVQSNDGRDDELLGKYEKKRNKRKRVTWKEQQHQHDDRPPNSSCTTMGETDANFIPAKVHKSTTRGELSRHIPLPPLPLNTQHCDQGLSTHQTHIQQKISSTASPPNWPENLIALISTVSNRPSPSLIPPLFSFELLIEAAQRNYCVLRKCGSLEQAIQQQKDSPVGYGSEFCHPTELEPILHLHPNWPHFHQLLQEGSDWPIESTTEEAHITDVNEALEFGNHKGATLNADTLRSLINDDVTHGYSLPLPLSKIHLLPGALLAPMNIVTQDTIAEKGNIIPKFRLTHDQSFKFVNGSNTSLNSRLQKEELLPFILDG